MVERLDSMPDRAPSALELPSTLELPSAREVASALAAVALAAPMVMGAPALPVMPPEERRRQQSEIVATSSSTTGIHETSAEARASLALSQDRLAGATLEVEGGPDHDVSPQDVVAAAERVFAGEAEEIPARHFRFAFDRLVWDTVDVCILEDNEEYARAERIVGA